MSTFVVGLVLLVGAGVLLVVRRATAAPALPIRLGALAAAVLGVVAVGASVVRIVPANNVGIPETLGSIGSPKSSGIHLTLPWTEMHTFSTRLQDSSMLAVSDEGDRSRDDAIEVRGSDGYSMKVDLTVRYAVEPDRASELFRRVGSMDGIRERLVRPEAREATRIVFARYSAEEGYSTGREKIKVDLDGELKQRLSVYGITLDQANIRNVDPEDRLKAAIGDRAAAREKALQAELAQKQAVTEAETRKQVATRDAEAKLTAAKADADATRIAAAGQAEANSTVSASLTPALIELERAKALSKANTIYVPASSTVVVAGANDTAKPAAAAGAASGSTTAGTPGR